MRSDRRTATDRLHLRRGADNMSSVESTSREANAKADSVKKTLSRSEGGTFTRLTSTNDSEAIGGYSVSQELLEKLRSWNGHLYADIDELPVRASEAGCLQQANDVAMQRFGSNAASSSTKTPFRWLLALQGRRMGPRVLAVPAAETDHGARSPDVAAQNHLHILREATETCIALLICWHATQANHRGAERQTDVRVTLEWSSPDVDRQ